ncbi:hypothetical protein DFH06DRAFT_1212566 [Mycena polygramma]|nr:hypothetical protein DFH06DRAFT_1212566 [Mycena polygramma]
MTVASGELHFDYAVITSDGPSPAESSASTSSSGSSSSAVPTPNASAHTSSAASSTSAPAIEARTRDGLSTGAVAGIAVGAILAGALIGAGIFLGLRSRNRAQTTAPGEHHYVPSPPDMHETGSNAPDIIAEMRMVRSQMERLEAQQKALQEGSRTSVLSDTESSVSRSLSTMKRDQTRVLRETTSTATNSLVRTESGLQLTAGSVIDAEVPPQYGQD